MLAVHEWPRVPQTHHSYSRSLSPNNMSLNFSHLSLQVFFLYTESSQDKHKCPRDTNCVSSNVSCWGPPPHQKLTQWCSFQWPFLSEIPKRVWDSKDCKQLFGPGSQTFSDPTSLVGLWDIRMQLGVDKPIFFLKVWVNVKRLDEYNRLSLVPNYNRDTSWTSLRGNFKYVVPPCRKHFMW